MHVNAEEKDSHQLFRLLPSIRSSGREPPSWGGYSGAAAVRNVISHITSAPDREITGPCSVPLRYLDVYCVNQQSEYQLYELMSMDGANPRNCKVSYADKSAI